MLSANTLLDELGQWHQRMSDQYAKADSAGEIMAAVATARVGISAIESFAKISLDHELDQRMQALEQLLNDKQKGG